jgi:hypothetical protein
MRGNSQLKLANPKNSPSPASSVRRRDPCCYRSGHFLTAIAVGFLAMIASAQWLRKNRWNLGITGKFSEEFISWNFILGSDSDLPLRAHVMSKG